ncbi:hypothetical protein K440DRAFT_681337 [Wilcoxina mikolae CBS 423.85]|nr:hypothetical protein K440DRAFT_681337 [Wilcoxina mikolae CBS 423.85]
MPGTPYPYLLRTPLHAILTYTDFTTPSPDRTTGQPPTPLSISPPSFNPFAVTERRNTSSIPSRFRVDHAVTSTPQDPAGGILTPLSASQTVANTPQEKENACITSPQVFIDGSPVYEVERLLETRKKNVKARNGKWVRAVQWLVKWKDYEEEDATWEEEQRLRGDLGEIAWGRLMRQYAARK